LDLADSVEHDPLFVVKPTDADNILLFNARVISWKEFRASIAPTPSIFLLPLIAGFSGPASNDVVEYLVPTPFDWLDNGTRFPMGVFVLSKRIAGEEVLIYGGTIMPTDPFDEFHGLRDSEIGTEWVIPSDPEPNTLMRESLNVIIPNDGIRASLVSTILKALPTLEQLVPGIIYPVSSKNYYVHPDGIFAWHTYDYPRPSGKDELESRFVLRNMRPSTFLYLMVVHNKITIDSLQYVYPTDSNSSNLPFNLMPTRFSKYAFLALAASMIADGS
jgi:hypothetical protein